MARTLLDAVNSCLRGIGAQSVSSLDDPNLDAGLASQTIESVQEDILIRGWWFNREPNWLLKPDTKNEIYVPNNALDIVSAGDSRTEQITIRGRKLYDVINHTTDMKGTLDKNGELNCTFIISLDFEEMPSAARRAVTYVARRLFAQDLEVDQARWNFQTRDEQVAMAQLERMEAKQRKHNYTNNEAINYFVSRVGGPNARGGYRNRWYAGTRGEKGAY